MERTATAVEQGPKWVLPAGDEVLGVRDGQLVIENEPVVGLAERFGTPLYVVSERQLRLNARRWRAAVVDGWPYGPSLVMPSLKANTSPALRVILNDEQLGCDVFGPNELEIALRFGVPTQKISLNGATKPEIALERAIKEGVRITLDSLDELERVISLARSIGRVATVRFRVRPALSGYDGRSELDLAGRPACVSVQEYRAGIPREELEECVYVAVRASEVDPSGFAAHATRQTADLAFWYAYAHEVGNTVATLARPHPEWVLREVDLGGGFAVPRDPCGRLLEHRRGATLAPTPEEYVHVLVEGLTDGLAEGGLEPDGIGLEVEPGRGIYGNAGIHLARVLHIKRERAPVPRTWIETDTSEVFLPDTFIEHNQWTALLADDPGRSERVVAAMTGVSCGFDVLLPPMLLPVVRPGEVMAFLDTGAYQDAAASSFNAMGRPATVLVGEGEPTIIKRRETLDEVVSRDVMPVGLLRRRVGVARDAGTS
jgi:diaminopimelate decarboxylase